VTVYYNEFRRLVGHLGDRGARFTSIGDQKSEAAGPERSGARSLPLERGYPESLAERKGLGIDSLLMKTAPLVVAVVTVAVLPAVLCSFGCNKKEDTPPAPSATAAVVAPPATAAPSATPLLPTQPTIPLLKTIGPRTDAGVTAGAKSDAAVVVARVDAAPPPVVVGLPPGIPTIALPPPSALPGLASSVVGGIIQHLPPPIIPAPNPSQ